MHDHDDLTSRLGDLGSATVPAGVRDGHLHAMRTADVAPAPERRGFGRLAVAAAAIVGFAVGSTGFAMAGALPGPAQGVAHDVLSVVQVDVPDGGNGIGGCMSQAAKTADPAEKKTAQDACRAGKAGGRPDDGTPGRSGEAPGRSGEAPGKRGEGKGRSPEAGPHPNADPSDCKGKPAWAAEKRKPTEAERTAREACPDDDGTEDGTEDVEGTEGAPGQEQRQGPPTETPAPRSPTDPPADPATPPTEPGEAPADPATPPDVPPAPAADVDEAPADG